MNQSALFLPPDWHARDLADAPPVPWKNGGGMTQELLAWPNAADWRLRISVARIERDGAFSSFPGVQRWFAVLAGDTLELTVAGAVHRLGMQSAPLAFDGAAQCHARLLGGATQDLNFMLNGVPQQTTTARMHRFLGAGRHAFEPLNTTNFIALCAVNSRVNGIFMAKKLHLSAHTLAWCFAADRLQHSMQLELASPDGMLLVMEAQV